MQERPHWSDGWIAKLKADQRALRADVAVLVTASLPKDCRRFALIDGVLVTDFACAGALAAVLRANLLELAQARNAAIQKHDTLELLHRYLSGVEFRQRVEAIVDAFTAMRADLDQERRAAERSWARRAKQIDAVTFNVAGFYGDLQGLLPALPSIGLLELPRGLVLVRGASPLGLPTQAARSRFGGSHRARGSLAGWRRAVHRIASSLVRRYVLAASVSADCRG